MENLMYGRLRISCGVSFKFSTCLVFARIGTLCTNLCWMSVCEAYFRVAFAFVLVSMVCLLVSRKCECCITIANVLSGRAVGVLVSDRCVCCDVRWEREDVSHSSLPFLP